MRYILFSLAATFCMLSTATAGFGQTAERSVMSVFSPVSDNDTLMMAGGQPLAVVSTDPLIKHGYYPLNYSLVSIPEIEQATEVHIYPNPFQSGFFIEVFYDDVTAIEMEVYASSGRLIFQQKMHPNNGVIHLNAENWAPGIYYISAYTTDKNVFHKKIVKNE